MITQDVFRAHQRQRLEALEDEARGELVELQSDARRLLLRRISQLKINSVIQHGERREMAAREQLLASATSVHTAVQQQLVSEQLMFVQGAGSAAAWDGSEVFRRISMEQEEASVRRSLAASANLAAINRSLATIDGDEQRWRREIALDAERRFRAIAADSASRRLWLIQSDADYHSEPTLRRFIVALEAKFRLRIAVHFCCLYVEWEEEWRRLTLRLTARVTSQYLSGLQRLWLAELREREDIAGFFAPVHADIIEELELRERRRRRRLNKLEWLRKLRMEEIERGRHREDAREEYVTFWRRDELDKILQIQEALVEEMAAYGNGGTAAVEAQLRRFSNDLLHLESASFAEVKRYRENLLGFNKWVTAIEGSVVSESSPPRILDRAGTTDEQALLLQQLSETNPRGRSFFQDPDAAVATLQRELSAGRRQRSAPMTRPTVNIDEAATGRDLLMLAAREERNGTSASPAPRHAPRHALVREPPPAFLQFVNASASHPRDSSPTPQSSIGDRKGVVSQPQQNDDEALVRQLAAEDEAVIRSRMRVNQFVDERERDDAFTKHLEQLHSWLNQHVSTAGAIE